MVQNLHFLQLTQQPKIFVVPSTLLELTLEVLRAIESCRMFARGQLIPRHLGLRTPRRAARLTSRNPIPQFSRSGASCPCGAYRFQVGALLQTCVSSCPPVGTKGQPQLVVGRATLAKWQDFVTSYA